MAKCGKLNRWRQWRRVYRPTCIYDQQTINRSTCFHVNPVIRWITGLALTSTYHSEPAGLRTAEFSFAEDGSLCHNSDAAWIRDSLTIKFVNYGPSQHWNWAPVIARMGV